MLILIVASGPEKGRVYELHDDQTVVLGRDGADLQFTDEKMSRQHARLWCDGGRWYVRDLGSSHGTLRNHLDIEKHLQPLKDGDAIQLGQTTLVVARISTDLTPFASSTRLASWSWINSRRGLMIGGAAAGLALLIGLNATLLLQTQRGVDQLSQTVADSTRQTLAADQQQTKEVAGLIANLGERQQQLMPRLETMLALIEQQPDVVGPLQALARAVQDNQKDPQLTEKLDTALALLRESGGEAEVMAARLTALLANRPELTDTADALRPLLQQVLATVQTLPTADDSQQLLAAVVDMRQALPTHQADTLALILNRLDDQPTNTQLAHVNRQLTLLAAELNNRDDAELIQHQLAQLLENAADAPAAALAAADDPILGQILSQIQTLAANNAKLDSILASVERQPYQNRAMLDEVLAQVNDDTSEHVVAALLDSAMAELRGKSITDADQLRRLIQRQVVASVGKAVGQPVPADDSDESRLTRTELAYKTAFESSRRITIGVARIRSPANAPPAAPSTPLPPRPPATAPGATGTSWTTWPHDFNSTPRSPAEHPPAPASMPATRPNPTPALSSPSPHPIRSANKSAPR